MDQPYPSCAGLLAQLEGAARHATQRLNFALVAKTPVATLSAFRKERGWQHLRLLSSSDNTFTRDSQGESAGGTQHPMMKVFQRDGAQIRHVWSSEMMYAPSDPGQDARQLELVEPRWNLFDLTRAGRPEDWQGHLSYPG